MGESHIFDFEIRGFFRYSSSTAISINFDPTSDHRLVRVAGKAHITVCSCKTLLGF